MNRSQLPLLGLRAFEATARHLSVSKAADELCVTPGAISQQVKNLEDQIGVELIRRVGRSIGLTDAGEVLLPHLTQVFDRISVTLDALARKPRTASLKIRLLPSLAERWLMPRLARFNGTHPEIDILILTSFRELDFGQEDYDMGSYVGNELPQGTSGIRLFDDEPLPVCSPKLLDAAGGHIAPQDLWRFTLLHSVRRVNDWHTGLMQAGLRDFNAPHNLKLGNVSLAIQAAIDHAGIAIAQHEYVRQNLAEGSLVAPFDLVTRSEIGYYFIWPTSRPESKAFQLFRDWVTEEATSSNQRLDPRMRRTAVQ